jgi:hypothetical protein
MGALLESGKVGNVSLNHLKAVRTDVINRWDSLGLLEGLAGHRKENIAQLFENQASHMLNESVALGNEGSFETVVFPIVRRVFSKLLANEIVSVQALNLPIGKLFYFIPKLENSAFATGSAGINPAGTPVSANLYDSFYGENGLYDNSKGAATTLTGTFAKQLHVFDGGTAADDTAAGYSEVAAVSNTTAIVTGTTGIIKVNFASAITNWENAEEVMSTLDVTSLTSGADFDFFLPAQKYGRSVMDASGNIYVAVVNNSSTVALPITGLTVTAKEYASLEYEDTMGEVSFELQSVTVSVIERKLRAQWSPELAQDVSAFHNIDAEAELTALLSEQVAAEIDREILRDLRRGAAWRMTWDYSGSRINTGGLSATNGYYTQKDWNQTLITAINQVSAQIHKATLRGGANWIVVSAEVSAILDDLEYFHVSNAAPEQDKYNMGIERIGSLGGRYQVYRDPYFPADTILMGHKGTSLLDTGYIYAPYVPMQLTPTMYNPFTFAPVKGIMTRYAKKMVNNRFYGVIKCQNIVSFGITGLR